MSSEFIVTAREKGVPAAWQTLDIGDLQEFAFGVRKGARHANAAKLVAVYLCSPEGTKFGVEEAKYGTLYYPGNYEHDIKLQNQKQGIPDVVDGRKMEFLDFYNSKEAAQLDKEIALILKTGGER